MNCVIDSAIMLLAKQGQNPKAIRRYIRMKYKVNIDLTALRQRLQRLKPQLDVESGLTS